MKTAKKQTKINRKPYKKYYCPCERIKKETAATQEIMSKKQDEALAIFKILFLKQNKPNWSSNEQFFTNTI